jgi:GlpG protein
MRVIGHLETDVQARTFGDFLYVQGIETEFERDGERWSIWVRSDDDIPRALKLLEEFRVTPSDPKFLAGSPAEKLREQAKAEDEAYRRRVVPARRLFPGLTSHGFGLVTYALIVGCIVVFVLSRMGKEPTRVSSLFVERIFSEGDSLYAEKHFTAIRHGEVWRLVTPMLVHFGFPHILFNMLWLVQLGSIFEARLRSWYFLLFVLFTSAISNFAEYFITRHALLGGMSGVVYGLIGYFWIRGRFDPGAGLSLDRQSLIIALIWLVACFTGYVGPIANYAHLSGLLVGMAWAFIDSKRA